LNESSTTPYNTDSDLIFTVTHPFHPLAGQQFPLIAQRLAWGEPRVFFHDPTTGRLRSLPTAWTNLAPPAPFVVLAAGRAILRFTDVQMLIRLLHDVDETLREVPQ
jgi:Family of unknown function (DUF5372)